jgi:hypothetical protein
VALRAWLADRSGHDADCSKVELRFSGTRAWVVLTTLDGRHAERSVGTAGELLPVVEALAITIPESNHRDGSYPDGSTSDRASAHGGLLADDVDSRSREAEAGPLPGVLFDARSGLRVPGPTACWASSTSTCTFALVSLGLGVSFHLGWWELGVAVSYEPAHATLNGAPLAGFSMSSYSAVLSVARHMSLATMDLALGATAGVQLTDESNQNTNGAQHGTQDEDSIAQPEPRTGLFAAIVVPQQSRLRFRPQLEFDLIPSHVGSSWSPAGSPLPALPWWSALASLGVQWQAP